MFLICSLLRKSVEEFVDSEKIVSDLLYVTRHLSQQNFEANFDGNIMVSTPTGSRKPMIVLVDVGTAAVAKQKKSWWEQLATFLEKINDIISYNPGLNTEMSTFIRYVRSGYRAPSKKESHSYLARLPLFSTPTERRIFVGDHWDLTKKISNGVAVYRHKPVYTNHPAPPHDRRTVVENELPWLVRANGGLDPAIPFKDTRGVRSIVEEETRAASSFARS